MIKSVATRVFHQLDSREATYEISVDPGGKKQGVGADGVCYGTYELCYQVINVYIYINKYIYIHVCVCVCVCVYIYIYIIFQFTHNYFLGLWETDGKLLFSDIS